MKTVMNKRVNCSALVFQVSFHLQVDCELRMSLLQVPMQDVIVRMNSPPPPLEMGMLNGEEESGYVAEFEESPFVYDIYADVTMHHLLGEEGMATFGLSEGKRLAIDSFAASNSLSPSIPRIFIQPPSPL